MSKVSDKQAEKVTTLADAVARLVPDGASVALGLCLESMIPFAAGHEIIRQGKRGLTLIGPISDILFDQMIGAGVARKVVAAWVGNVMMGSAYNFRRAMEDKIPHEVEVINHSNFTIALALHAGALGVPFLPTYTSMGSDILARNPDLVEFTAPFAASPEEARMVAVRAITPDVAIVQAQRADVYGNAHLWGNFGAATDAVRAAKHVIVVTEEIVQPKIISSDPNRTVVPGFLVSAVCEVPFGAHPSPIQGYYNRDDNYYAEYHKGTKTRADFDAWLARWVTGVKDRAAFMETLGAERAAGLKVKKPAFAAKTDFGH